jgi:hypothetical protein
VVVVSGGPDDDALGFKPPPFDAAGALAQLQRALRDARLAERGTGFELRGRRVAELALDGATVQARLARRPALTPEWDRFTVDGAAAQRKLLDELRRRLARWDSGED